MTPDLAKATAGDRSVVDVRVLEEFVGAEPEVVTEFLQEYRTSARALVADIRAARDTGDLAAIGGAAHKLKSASRAIGARTLGDLAAALETAATLQHEETVHSLLPEFDLAVAAVEQALGGLLAAS